MIEQIKATTINENNTLKALFNAVPTHKFHWENLQEKLRKNSDKQIINLENLTYQKKQFADVLKNINETKILNVQQIKENHEKQIILNQKAFEKQILSLKDAFFALQTNIKRDLEEIESKSNENYLLLNQKITQIKNDLNEEVLILKTTLKEHKIDYLNKVSNIYNLKESEAERITSKFHDQIQDYHQKNKQRITQNTLKISEEDLSLENYLKFHEKDEVYAKQNYLKTVTNLNDKIYHVTNNYKEIEERIESTFIAQNNDLLLNLDEKKKEVEGLINTVLAQYEKEYQEIDTNLDLIRDKYHNDEIKLKTKYDRQVTSINISLHNNKEDINSLLANLNSKTKEQKREIVNLNKKLNLLEKDAQRQIKLAKKEYKTNYNKATKAYVSSSEINLFKRTLAEEDKNNLVGLYNNLYSLEENHLNNLIKFTKTKTDIKKEIINNYIQLEIAPLESQNELANHIYSLELKLQKLENEYLYLKTSKRKQLANLKSFLHKYNLEKTRNRTQFNYDLELTISNLTNYLLMEKEKNEFVYQNRLIKLQKEAKEVLANQKKLEVNAEISLNNLQKKYKIDFFNFLLQSKIEIKNLDTNLITENNSYIVDRENLLNKHLHNHLDRKEFSELLENENFYFDEILSSHKDFYNLISSAENEILAAFLTNTPKNTNFDDFQVFLTTTKELLLLKNYLLKSCIDNLIIFLEEHNKKNTTNFLEPNLNTYKNTINDYYYKQVDMSLKDREIIINRVNQVKERITEVKESLSSLKEHLSYSYKTIEYSNQELNTLKKTVQNEKNKKIIKDLNEHILINKKFQQEKFIEKKELLTELKKLKNKSKKLKKSIKKINNELSKKEKNKNKSLQAGENFINNQVSVFKEFLKTVNILNASFEKTSINYTKNINDLSFNQTTLKKTKSLLIGFLNKKDNFFKTCFTSLHTSKNIAHKKLNKNYLKYKKLATKKEYQELLRLEKLSTKSSKKINREIKSAIKRHKKDLNRLLKKEIKSTKSLKKENQENLNILNTIIENANKSILKHEDNYKNLKTALEINKQASLLNEKELLKTTYRTLVKRNQKDIKETKHNIKKINTDMEYDDKKHKARLNFLLKKDKQIRKKILQKQNSSKNYHSLQVENLRRKIPKINLEIRYLKARKTLNESEIKKEIHSYKSQLNFIKRFSLKFNIWNKTKALKKEFKNNFK